MQQEEVEKNNIFAFSSKIKRRKYSLFHYNLFYIIIFMLFASILDVYMYIYNLLNLQPLTNCYNLLGHSSENLILQVALIPLG